MYLTNNSLSQKGKIEIQFFGSLITKLVSEKELLNLKIKLEIVWVSLLLEFSSFFFS